MDGDLKMLAKTTGGLYVHATRSGFGLRSIYDQKLAKMEKTETETKRIKVYKERFQIPLTLAFLFLLLEMILRRKREA